jgi:hypothetical protein
MTFICTSQRTPRAWRKIRSLLPQLRRKWLLFCLVRSLRNWTTETTNRKWLRFCLVRSLGNWTIEITNNAFCWYCCFRSGITELLQWRCVSTINALKTSKFTWHSVRTSQSTPRAWSKNQSATAVTQKVTVVLSGKISKKLKNWNH